MIKIRFWSDTKQDVCAILEEEFQKDVEQWIQKNVIIYYLIA